MHTHKKLPIMPFLVIGLLSGISLALLVHYKINHMLPYFWISSFSFMFLLAFDCNKSLFALVMLSITTSFVVVAPFIWLNSSNYFSELFLPLISAYAVNSFHLAYQQDGFKLTYPSLFYAVWDTPIKGSVSIFFTGLCWAILYIWSALFGLIGITFFTKLFSNIWFAIVITVLFAAIGLYIAQKANMVIRNLRFLLLQICQWLLPVLSIIGLLFIIAWAFMAVFTTKANNISPYIFSSYCVFMIVFINGVYQDSHIESPYPGILATIINFSVIILPIFTLAILYTLIFPLASVGSSPSDYQLNVLSVHGLNSFNFNALINSSFLFIYSVGYAVITIRHRHVWHKSLGKVNVFLALLLIATNLFINNYFFYHASFNPGKTKSKVSSPKINAKTKAKNQFEQLSQRLTSSNILWQDNATNALTLAVQNNQKFSICRTKINNDFLPGIMQKKQCQIISGKTLMNVNNFQILSGPENVLIWQSWLDNYSMVNKYGPIPVVVSLEHNDLQFICRTIYNNQVYLGIYSLKNSQCRIIVNHTFVKTTALKYLYTR